MTRKKHRLSVFLIKEEAENVTDFVCLDGLHIVEIPEQADHQAVLAYKSGIPKKPDWTKIFENVDGFDAEKIVNRSSRAIYVIQVSNRWFVFTFGYARHLINDDWFERNFGLKVALNMCDPDSIRGIDKTNFGHVSLRSKEQATREIEISGFEFQDDVDLLKSLTGYRKDEGSDTREVYSGRDSVSIRTKVTLEDFPEIAEKLYDAYSDDRYKELYPWIDNVVEERDKSIISGLWEEVCRRLKEGDFDNVWMAIPEVIQWENVSGFRFQRQRARGRNSPPLHYDIDVRNWVQSVSERTQITLKFLKSDKISIVDINEQVVDQWSASRCLNAEVDYNDEKYILNDGSWFKVNGGFVAAVERFYESVDDANLGLPAYQHYKEPEYLRLAANPPDIVLMDRNLVPIGGGRSRVEFCDLYTRNQEIIHVKKYGGSSLLGHLFNQALVSAESMLNDKEFREEVNEYLPQDMAIPVDQRDIKASDYTVVLAVMSNRPGNLELPFFSKVVFRHAVRNMRNMGFSVYKEKINQ